LFVTRSTDVFRLPAASSGSPPTAKMATTAATTIT
jgi:hypothetical protein